MAPAPGISGADVGHGTRRVLIAGLYLTALALVLTVVSNALPLMTKLPAGTAPWRYLVFGIVFLHVVLPLLGMALASLTAAYFGHLRTLRVLVILQALMGIALVAGFVVFALDGVELAPQINPTIRGRFFVSVLKAGGNALGAGLLLLILSFCSWRAQRFSTPKVRTEPTKKRDLLVGSQG